MLGHPDFEPVVLSFLWVGPMGTNPDIPDGPGKQSESERLSREIASFRTYLLFVAGRLPGVGASDLVHSVLAEAIDEVRRRDGRFTFKSSAGLKAWLVKRMRWMYWERLRRRRRDERLLRGLPSPRSSRTPGSEFEAIERDRLVTDALTKLDPADRRLIEWRHDERLKFKEIGLRRGCSTSRARRAYLEAIEKFASVYQSIRGTDPGSVASKVLNIDSATSSEE
jgi:RNA polymerase sigma factor (sigma-70 family)